ncbi:hypothetical protein IWW52_006277, partial [Coemansia sp. RSA 2704]
MKFSQTFMALAAFSSTIAAVPMKRNLQITNPDYSVAESPAYSAPAIPSDTPVYSSVEESSVEESSVDTPEQPGYSAIPPPPVDSSEESPSSVEDYTTSSEEQPSSEEVPTPGYSASSPPEDTSVEESESLPYCDETPEVPTPGYSASQPPADTSVEDYTTSSEELPSEEYCCENVTVTVTEQGPGATVTETATVTVGETVTETVTETAQAACDTPPVYSEESPSSVEDYTTSSEEVPTPGYSASQPPADTSVEESESLPYCDETTPEQPSEDTCTEEEQSPSSVEDYTTSSEEESLPY